MEGEYRRVIALRWDGPIAMGTHWCKCPALEGSFERDLWLEAWSTPYPKWDRVCTEGDQIARLPQEPYRHQVMDD